MMRISGTYPFRTDPDPIFALRTLSFGAGVQSTRLLLGVIEGEFGEWGGGAPVCGIHADTQWEPAPVQRHRDKVLDVAARAGFPVYVVTAGNIRTQSAVTTRRDGREGRKASLPLHTSNLDGEAMMMRRQCTREFKIEPIEKEQRRLLGLKPRQRCRVAVESWQGISLDEISRISVNRTGWVWNRYPLIERRETRAACLSWLAKRGWTDVPKSACVGCPYHDNAYWRWLKEASPEDFEAAVAFDHAANAGQVLGWDRPAYVHRSMVPLDQVNLLDPHADQLDLVFGECEGICGV